MSVIFTAWQKAVTFTKTITFALSQRDELLTKPSTSCKNSLLSTIFVSSIFKREIKQMLCGKTPDSELIQKLSFSSKKSKPS